MKHLLLHTIIDDFFPPDPGFGVVRLTDEFVAKLKDCVTAAKQAAKLAAFESIQFYDQSLEVWDYEDGLSWIARHLRAGNNPPPDFVVADSLPKVRPYPHITDFTTTRLDVDIRGKFKWMIFSNGHVVSTVRISLDAVLAAMNNPAPSSKIVSVTSKQFDSLLRRVERSNLRLHGTSLSMVSMSNNCHDVVLEIRGGDLGVVENWREVVKARFTEPVLNELHGLQAGGR